MTEPAGFEARAVIAPRRPRVARLALLVPLVALVLVAWAGSSGPRSDQTAADVPGNTAAATATSNPGPGSTPPIVPVQAIGIHVQRLDQVPIQTLGPEDDVALSGWYVATRITDCPPLAAFFQVGPIPDLRRQFDPSAFCHRSGVFYVSQPDVRDSSSRGAGLLAVGATIGLGVVMPPELEVIGADATQVVVIGRFVPSAAGCGSATDCPRELVVDHVAWTPGA